MWNTWGADDVKPCLTPTHLTQCTFASSVAPSNCSSSLTFLLLHIPLKLTTCMAFYHSYVLSQWTMTPILLSCARTKEINKENRHFTPFYRHTQQAVLVPLDSSVAQLGKHFYLCVLPVNHELITHPHTHTHICELRVKCIAMVICPSCAETIWWYNSLPSIKMVAAVVSITPLSKRDQRPF